MVVPHKSLSLLLNKWFLSYEFLGIQQTFAKCPLNIKENILEGFKEMKSQLTLLMKYTA